MADLNIGNSSTSVVVNAKHNGSVTPQIDKRYDLGTSDLRWKNIYGNLEGNALTVGQRNDPNTAQDANDLILNTPSILTFYSFNTNKLANIPSIESNWGYLTVGSHNGGYNYQTYIDGYDGTTWNRVYKSGTWSAWKKVLDSSNYTSYTVTKAGSGANGTWGISISGNAATATKLATARTIRTNLASTSTASFNGTANITPGVTGTLPIANGGTGATTASSARDNLGAQSKVLYGPSAPSDSTGSNGDMYIALESGDFKKDIVDLIYPVGSIYISMNSTNPSTLFGGTWEAFGQGRVLIGAGTVVNDGSTSLSFTAGSTGGEYKHKLTSSEIPSHSHSFSGTTSANNRSHTHSYTKATGVQGHTLTIAEMPSHSHNFTVPISRVWNSGGGAAYQLDSSREDRPTYDNYISSTGGGGSHSHGLSTSSANSGSESQNHTHTYSGTTTSTGSGNSHNNIQPYIVVYMWKRTA